MRKKKRLISNMGMICLVSIVSINLIGVGYGMWNDRVNIETNISTGNINPLFDDDNNRNINDDNSELALILSNGSKTLTVSGSCYADSLGDIEIFIGVNDLDGSIPTMFDEEQNINDPNDPIIISKANNGISLIIKANESSTEEIISINKDIAFIPFNQTISGGWIEYLNLKANIEVINPESIQESNKSEEGLIENVAEEKEEPKTEETPKIETKLELEEDEGFETQPEPDPVELDNTRVEGE